jgi:hypothetical protein
MAFKSGWRAGRTAEAGVIPGRILEKVHISQPAIGAIRWGHRMLTTQLVPRHQEMRKRKCTWDI